ncbi:MAG TPA: hypothetical protein VEU55_04550 [Gemmatimonadales bacterium]|nr:hypothetical protein [Gemmatimonadales bacterium]
MDAGQTAGRRPVGPAVLLCLVGLAAHAQVAANRTTLYLHPTDVTDARALWVNPAGLARFDEASLHTDVTVGDPGAAGRLRQLTVGFVSRGFSFGYQRDIFAAGARGHTYRLGLATAHARLAAGVALALYRGGTSATGWDLGALYAAAPGLTFGAVIEHLGQPTVRDSTLPVTYVPGATVRLGGTGAALSAHGRLTSHGVTSYALGLRVGFREATALPIHGLARVDTDRALTRTGFAFGISLGGQDVAGAVATTPGDASRVDALSLYGVSTRRPGR